ncbi:Potassium channel KAT1 [Acorus calamus]|uniref:Potassium channel KAT1 n=1 Tax=Acorus calamus TaxID=4465 RepID=A0AAV9F529_ACOCL|nr:Potassium channel KAT1 [Acorus calamus]
MKIGLWTAENGPSPEVDQWISHHVHQQSLQQFFSDELQVEGNSCSFSSDLLPSLGATINQSARLRRFIVSPYDHRYR